MLKKNINVDEKKEKNITFLNGFISLHTVYTIIISIIILFIASDNLMITKKI